MKIPSLKIKIHKFKKGTVLRTLLILALAGLAVGLGAHLRRLHRHQGQPARTSPTSTPSGPSSSPRSTPPTASRSRSSPRRSASRSPTAGCPRSLVNAIVATEDPSFFRHGGIDLRGILRAVWADVFKVIGGKRPEGGSTITQQLARSLFLHREVSLRRKLKELYVSREIEKLYPKEKILELYCNHFYLGHGTHGVQAASNLFFGKDVKDLSRRRGRHDRRDLPRAVALFALHEPKVTFDRRNHVLNRLVAEGYLTRAEGDALKQKPMEVLPLRRTSAEFGAYFFEEVRRYLEKNYGYDGLYRAGPQGLHDPRPDPPALRRARPPDGPAPDRERAQRLAGRQAQPPHGRARGPQEPRRLPQGRPRGALAPELGEPGDRAGRGLRRRRPRGRARRGRPSGSRTPSAG
ncbi:MAG: transglycosylase domain-containing protein [Candidatus Moduliflexus flocculans]|nr:transglycosylase domain-containing protein [Candidatus Moduliflexus flocculans]